MAAKTPIIGISPGDINGIGLEVVYKSLVEDNLAQQCIPIIYAHRELIRAYFLKMEITHYSMPMLWNNSYGDKLKGQIFFKPIIGSVPKVNFGTINASAGVYANNALDTVLEDLRNLKISILVTAPIHKKAMELANFGFPGHTEYLTHHLSNGKSLMLLMHNDLRVGLVTNHVPITQLQSTISEDLILNKIRVFNRSLKMDFGIEVPRIAVLGLNPHAGDFGAIGQEEVTIIMPAMEKSKSQNIRVEGPFPADGFFGSRAYQNYDGILAMYHDQGLIPFKTLSFGNGVNYTAGLQFIRTSPDHGTGMDIAGKNLADSASFSQAMRSAISIYQSRTKI